MKFIDYVHRHDNIIEMARLAPEEQIPFDPYDIAYLKEFPQQLWAKALLFRYSKKLLGQSPELDKIEVKMDLSGKLLDELDNEFLNKHGFKVSGGGKQKTITKTIDVNVAQLLDKISEAGFDPERVNISRDMSERAAKKMIDHNAGKKVDNFGFSMASAKKGHAFGSTTKKDLTRIEHEPEKHGGKYSMEVFLDDEDKKVLHWLDKTGNGDIKVVTLMKMYDGSHGFLNPDTSRKIGNLTYQNIIQGSKLNLEKLQVRLKKLQSQGVDFFITPLDRTTAGRWIERGFMRPGWKMKNQDIGLLGLKKFETIKKFEQEQNDYLRGVRDDSPGTDWVAIRGEPFDYQKSWLEILHQEAQIAVRRGMALMRAKSNFDEADIDVDALENGILSWLSNEKTAADPNYASQLWRLDKAKMQAWAEIKKKLDEKGAVTKGREGVLAKEKQRAISAGLDTSKLDISKIEQSKRELVKNILQAQPEAHNVPDTAWDKIINNYFRSVHAWVTENGRSPNKTELAILSRDVLQPYAHTPLALAAQEPLKPKINPAQKEI